MKSCDNCRKHRWIECPNSAECYSLDDKPHFEPRLNKCVYYYEHSYTAMNPENSCRIACCANKSINKPSDRNRNLCVQSRQKQHECWRIKPLSMFERIFKYHE